MINTKCFTKQWIEQKSLELNYSIKLNKLKLNNPEAFYYWYKTEELLSNKAN